VCCWQVPDSDKRQRADFVIDTSVALPETRQHVASLVKAVQGRRGKYCESEVA
jgi:dephospho-CoA kinase